VGFIVGEPGIGETALVDTFVAQAAAAHDIAVGRGQCVEDYGTGEPYLPMLEALGRLCRGVDADRFVSNLRRYAPVGSRTCRWCWRPQTTKDRYVRLKA
jgi:hypothetical protein